MGMAQKESAGVAGLPEAAFDGNEPLLVAALRRRDEAAFVALVRRYHGLMPRVAHAQFKDRAACEEVVQENWLAVIKGIDSFEGRSSLRTWTLRILTYRHRRGLSATVGRSRFQRSQRPTLRLRTRASTRRSSSDATMRRARSSG
jgi:DNA-directed RNA polymerase specialized sigma24 family protein